MTNQAKSWKKCSICKTDIPVKTKYWVCNVSTCNGKRTGLVFCSISCFERHLPGARHKDAYALEETSPSQADTVAEPVKTNTPQRRIISSTIQQPTSNNAVPKETLVVVSKLKDYINNKSGMNTSASCNSKISDIIRLECDKAIDSARRDGRKTVLDRDFK